MTQCSDRVQALERELKEARRTIAEQRAKLDQQEAKMQKLAFNRLVGVCLIVVMPSHLPAHHR